MTSRIGEETRARIRAAWPVLLTALSDGALVRDALKDAGISDSEKRAYLATEPGARKEWDEARESSADAFMDEAIALARQGMTNKRAADSGHARNALDTLKWAARIRNPRTYAEKQNIDLNVRTVDLTQVIAQANARLIAARTGRLIDGSAERVPDELPALDAFL